MRTSIRISAAALCLAGAIAGCGGSKPLSKAEFISKADAICAKGNAEIQAAGRKAFPTRPTPAQLVPFIKSTLIPNIQNQLDQVRKLKPPTSDASTVKSILDSVQQGINEGKANPVLLAGNGPGPFAAANQKSKAYGLKTCGSS